MAQPFLGNLDPKNLKRKQRENRVPSFEWVLHGLNSEILLSDIVVDSDFEYEDITVLKDRRIVKKFDFVMTNRRTFSTAFIIATNWIKNSRMDPYEYLVFSKDYIGNLGAISLDEDEDPSCQKEHSKMYGLDYEWYTGNSDTATVTKRR